jgi:hypothetical protein
MEEGNWKFEDVDGKMCTKDYGKSVYTNASEENFVIKQPILVKRE